MPKVDTKTARAKLEFRRDPYWQRVAPKLYVGYRVCALGGEGYWRGRWRDETGRKYLAIDADELAADELGKDTQFRQAEHIVRNWHKALEQGVTSERLTVADVVHRYLKSKTKLPLDQIKAAKHGDLSRDDRNVKKSLSVFERHVIAHPVSRQYLDKLRTVHLDDWLNGLTADVDPMSHEELRAAKSTANRTWASFRAALNWAFKKKYVASDNAWRAVESYTKVEASREFIPAATDITALYAVAPPEIVRVCEFLRLTGCRPGEAYKATVGALEGKTLKVDPDTKTGSRVISLSTEAAEFIAGLAVGKIKKAPLLVRDDGEPWETAELNKRFRVARDAAGYSFEFVPYSFRHLWITDACRGTEMGVMEIAITAGTSVEMIQKHYAKLQHGKITAALDNLASIRAKEQA